MTPYPGLDSIAVLLASLQIRSPQDRPRPLLEICTRIKTHGEGLDKLEEIQDSMILRKF